MHAEGRPRERFSQLRKFGSSAESVGENGILWIEGRMVAWSAEPVGEFRFGECAHDLTGLSGASCGRASLRRSSAEHAGAADALRRGGAGKADPGTGLSSRFAAPRLGRLRSRPQGCRGMRASCPSRRAHQGLKPLEHVPELGAYRVPPRLRWLGTDPLRRRGPPRLPSVRGQRTQLGAHRVDLTHRRSIWRSDHCGTLQQPSRL